MGVFGLVKSEWKIRVERKSLKRWMGSRATDGHYVLEMDKEENQVWCDWGGSVSRCVREGVVVIKVMEDKDSGLLYGKQE